LLLKPDEISDRGLYFLFPNTTGPASSQVRLHAGQVARGELAIDGQEQLLI